MKNLFYVLSFSIFLFCCNSEKKQTSQSFQQKQVDKLLTENNIFLPDSIDVSLKKISKDQITKGKQLFMQGLDFYINKKNPAESAKLFHESVLYYPDNKTYTYLANAYVDLGDTTNADKAIDVVGYDASSYEVSYTIARIYAVKKDTSLAVTSLGDAFSQGFINKKRLDNDKCFDAIRGTRGFVSLLVTYMKDENKLKEVLLKSFLASFPDTKFPFEMMKDSVCIINQANLNNSNFINYDFAPFIKSMEDGRFSRDVSNEYMVVSKFKTSNGINAVIYKTLMIIVDTLPPVDIKIATYDSLGNFIDEKLFAQYALPETLLTGKIDENGIICVKEFKMKWKKNPLEEGYAGNEYLGEDAAGETKFKISSDGHFVSYQDNIKTDVVKK